MCYCILANENRYEGSWKDDKKHGEGKFFYLNKGQLYIGVWVDDIAKCGTMEDFGREGAPQPTIYPIPKVRGQGFKHVIQVLKTGLPEGFAISTKLLFFISVNSMIKMQ